MAPTNRLVTLVNPNKLHPGVAPYALDILTTSLEDGSFDVEVVDLTFRRDRWQEALAEYFSHRTPLLVGVTIRNTDTIYPQDQTTFLPAHREVINEIQRLTTAPIVAGGVGFSSMPYALVAYLGIDYGVKGPGEVTICQLAEALRAGRAPDDVPGLLVNRGDGLVERNPLDQPIVPLAHRLEGRVSQVNRSTPYRRRSGLQWRVDNGAYYRRGGLGNILTKNGCPYACTHCVEPDAKGNQFARRSTSAVVDEIEMLVDQGIYDLHTTDSEFNLNIANSKAVLREIVRRKDADAGSALHELRLWIYVQPTPFDEEFAELLAAAGCRGINVAPDHVRDDLLDRWKVTGKGSRFYTFEDAQTLCELAQKYDLLTMVEVLLGMPGETIDTIRECIDATLALDATVVGYTLGLRLFPYSPLGIWAAEECGGERMLPGLQSDTATSPIVLKPLRKCASPTEYEEQFMLADGGHIRPVYYFSPDLPEEPDVVANPAGRRIRTLELMWQHVPKADHRRVMLPTSPGLSEHDNNVADNPFVTTLVALGYKGAFWSHWPRRQAVLDEGRANGIHVPA